MPGYRLFAYLLFFALWTWVAFWDWRKKKISNRVVAAGLVGLAAICCLDDPSHRCWVVALQMAVAAAVSLAFWRGGIWPSGDSKLFVLLAGLAALLMPAPTVSPVHLVLFLLVNTFIPAALFHGAATLLKLISQPRKGAEAKPLRQRLVPGYSDRALGASMQNLGHLLFLYVISILWYQWGSERFGQKALVYLVVGFWAISRQLGQLLRPNPRRGALIGALLVVALGALWLQYRSFPQHFLRDVTRLGLFAGALRVVTVVVEAALRRTEIRAVPAEGLRPSLVLAEDFVQKLARDSSFLKERLGWLYPDGLSHEQAELVRDWCRKNGVGLVEVYETYPFAFWMFLGTFLTSATGRDILSLARDR